MSATLSSAGLDEALHQAILNHQQGKLMEAAGQYRAVLGLDPGHGDAHHNLGVVEAQLGDFNAAQPHLRAAIEQRPDKAQHWLSYGQVLLAFGHARDAVALLEDIGQRGLSGPAFDALLASARAVAEGRVDGEATALLMAAIAHHAAGRQQEAGALYARALALKPDFAEALSNLGILFYDQGRHDEAIASYRRAIAIKPDLAEGHNNLGNALKARGRLEDAAVAYREACARKPDLTDAHVNLGAALKELGALDEAEAALARALALNPDHPEALKHMGAVLCETDRVRDGFAALMRQAQLKGAPGGTGESPHRLRHDLEQRAYLTGLGVADDGRPLSALMHIEGGERQPRAVNARNDLGEIERQWRDSHPQLVVIDNLLTQEALGELRRFCLGSTVWREPYKDGYLGAFPEDGFACPLLAQIAEELRLACPAIFGAHPLTRSWGFKYDSHLSGINLHADFAAVNVNFWITPDEANRDPEGGGMVIWDVAAPLDWNFNSYNGDVEAGRAFLDKAGAKAVRVPYRANRAVIFDSDLFHETDRLSFRDGYENRRINVTMLYGKRENHRP